MKKTQPGEFLVGEFDSNFVFFELREHSLIQTVYDFESGPRARCVNTRYKTFVFNLGVHCVNVSSVFF